MIPSDQLPAPQARADHELVALDKFYENAIKAVKDQLKLHRTPANEEQRIPPLLLSRFARGGKTTALKKLAEKLHGEGILPILISFNGQDGGFSPRDGEDDKSALLRQISRQLLVNEPRDEAICTEQQLEDYFQGAGKPVVLLVDELNKLRSMLEHKAVRFLREVFQNKKDRAVVFTTHRPFLLSSNADSSARGPTDSAESSICIPNVLNLPDATLTELRRMSDATRALTRAQAVQHMMCPALIYSAFVDPDGRGVRKLPRSLQLPLRGPRLAAFCREFITGGEELHDQNVLYREYTAVTDFSAALGKRAERRVRWPLAFLKDLFDTPDWKKDDLAARSLSSVEKMDTEHDGKVWELVVLQAFQVQCLRAREMGCGIAELGDMENDLSTGENVRFLRVPDEREKLADSLKHVDEEVQQWPDNKKKSVVIVSFASARHEAVDGLLLRYGADGVRWRTIGWQCKAGEERPKEGKEKLQELNRGLWLPGAGA
uniref:ORC1/DEAH AAA+ ATPase domain-containing protein n=1 Tax=Chromera velia CCMP2878 TaxID=1169474 RepID=A0A0G4GZP1_9ALVE|eukprot:Cvel_24017.t1-p1 / transcript=Cvel_24017.t1 / gene=Cvel_24017 / organism=Chromera_velia_CCMP2878 / gene_product=hypothetical protein / transcript_product=hypothetical protein / location=Cvel_scaffold2548:4622-6085(-) / protein_length=488 / sequence_SO=supercontig / SO=protein_coding / is_pseudo=false